jgi:DNA-directed RNA polymerase specialized sigma24 family protein
MCDQDGVRLPHPPNELERFTRSPVQKVVLSALARGMKSDFDAGAGRAEFATTHWSAVLAAGHATEATARRALEQLCRAYWYPLYAYVRRRGFGPDEAQDLTQSFFQRLIEKQVLALADRHRGKFRSFLLGSLNNFLANEWDKSQRLKRGGAVSILSLDAVPAEERYQLEPVDNATPEVLYERRWAQAVLEQAVGRMEAEYERNGQGARFAVLKDFLMGDSGKVSYDAAAQRLNLTVSALTSAVHRLRGRFRDVFREEIAHTVATPIEVDEEIQHLMAVL